MSKKQRPYFVTSRRLAERLSMSGATLTPIENVYHPGEPAWSVPLTVQTARIIKDFSNEAGWKIPQVIYDILTA